MRRPILLASLTALALALAVSVALAAVPAGATYDGTSSHKRYGVSLVTECFTGGCTKAATVAFTVTAGNAAHPHAKCASGNYQLNVRLRKGNTFSGKGQFVSRGKLITFRVSGKFISRTVAKGKVTGPKVCGGTQTYRATLQPGGY